MGWKNASKEIAMKNQRNDRKTEFQKITIKGGKENNMIGAIVGDIVGSVYEWNNIKTKDFLFLKNALLMTQ